MSYVGRRNGLRDTVANRRMLTRRDLGKLAVALPLMVATSTSAREAQPALGAVSDHFDGKRFFNPGGRAPRGFGDVLRWQFGGGKAGWPKTYPSPFPPDRPPPRVLEGLRVVLVGHSSFLVQGGGLNILIDPIWSDRASPVAFAGPRRRNAPGIVFDDLPPIDVVLVSHDHYDHLDRPTIERLWRRDRPLFVAPLGNEASIRSGTPQMRVTTADWGEVVTLDAQASVRLEPARHWSTRGLGDQNRSLWSAFTLRLGNRIMYYAGDTGFADGRNFEQAAARSGPIDLALLPIGAYAPRWFMKDQHMNPHEAVRAFELLGARHALGCHWGTFQLADEGVDQPMIDLAAALAARGIASSRFLAARPGQSWTTVEPPS